MTDQEKAVLHGCGLFAHMERSAVEPLLGCLHAERAEYEKNQVIWHMGDTVSACVLVLSGAVRAETVNAAGEHTLMAYHTPGALVGDVLMATPGGTSPVYILAAERTAVLFLPYGAIMGGCGKCCPQHLRLRENLISEIAQKYWAQRRHLSYLSVGSLRQRIGLYLADRAAAAGSTTFRLEGTREDLADYLCVNRSALCRELGRMKAEGILDFYRESFRILRPELLTR